MKLQQKTFLPIRKIRCIFYKARFPNGKHYYRHNSFVVKNLCLETQALTFVDKD